MNTAAYASRTIWERIAHALVFEVIAIALTAAAIVLAMDKPLASASGLAVAVSTIAMLWNMLFNAAFDRAQAKMEFRRTIRVRAVHAFLFEAGLTLAVVPLAAWWLAIGLLQAFLLDLGVLVFFLFYTFVYNLCYDLIRARVVARYCADPVGSAVPGKAAPRPPHPGRTGKRPA